MSNNEKQIPGPGLIRGKSRGIVVLLFFCLGPFLWLESSVRSPQVTKLWVFDNQISVSHRFDHTLEGERVFFLFAILFVFLP